MKKLKKVLIVLLMCICVSGCGSTKETLDPRDIQSILEEASFEIYDSTEQVGYAEKAFYGIKGQVTANFVKGEKKYDIQGVFLDECKNVYSKVTNDYKRVNDGGKNWTYLIVTDKDKYYFVGWVDDSYITIDAPADQEKLMNKLVKELGFK